MQNIWHDMDSARISPDNFMCVIEIPQGSKAKYELDKQSGLLKLDRILYTSTHYPANYGFIPRTYAEDLDPLDVLVLCSEQIYPLTLVQCYPIGYITMLDNGRNDYKIIAIPFNDPTFNSYTDIAIIDSVEPFAVSINVECDSYDRSVQITADLATLLSRYIKGLHE